MICKLLSISGTWDLHRGQCLQAALDLHRGLCLEADLRGICSEEIMNMIIGIQLQVQNGSSFLHSRGLLLRLLCRQAALAAMVQALPKALLPTRTIRNQLVNPTQHRCRDTETIQHMDSYRIRQRSEHTPSGTFLTQETETQGSTLELIPNVGTIS